MQPSEPTSVALVIANNLPAILTAAVPIVTSIVGLIMAFMANRKANAANAANATTQNEVAQVKSTTNRVIAVTKALRDKAVTGTVVQKSATHSISQGGDPTIPELPEPLQ